LSTQFKRSMSMWRPEGCYLLFMDENFDCNITLTVLSTCASAAFGLFLRRGCLNKHGARFLSRVTYAKASGPLTTPETQGREICEGKIGTSAPLVAAAALLLGIFQADCRMRRGPSSSYNPIP
jgi:hypothetical protein